MFPCIIINKQRPDWVGIYDPQNPPDTFFDTNVWISMNDKDIDTLELLKNQDGFRYRYSIINYVALVSPSFTKGGFIFQRGEKRSKNDPLDYTKDQLMISNDLTLTDYSI